MQTVESLASFSRELVSANSASELAQIQQLMVKKNVSMVPILDERPNSGPVKNVGVVRKKTLWLKMLQGSAFNTQKEAREDPLPEVRLTDSLNEAMKKLNENSALLIRNQDGTITSLISPRVVATALEDYSKKFRLFEELEEQIRALLKPIQSEVLTELGKTNSENRSRKKVSLEELTYSDYHWAIGKFWDQLRISHFNRKLTLGDIDTVREIRNNVMHFRLSDKDEVHKIDELMRILQS